MTNPQSEAPSDTLDNSNESSPLHPFLPCPIDKLSNELLLSIIEFTCPAPDFAQRYFADGEYRPAPAAREKAARRSQLAVAGISTKWRRLARGCTKIWCAFDFTISVTADKTFDEGADGLFLLSLFLELSGTRMKSVGLFFISTYSYTGWEWQIAELLKKHCERIERLFLHRPPRCVYSLLPKMVNLEVLAIKLGSSLKEDRTFDLPISCRWFKAWDVNAYIRPIHPDYKLLTHLFLFEVSMERCYILLRECTSLITYSMEEPQRTKLDDQWDLEHGLKSQKPFPLERPDLENLTLTIRNECRYCEAMLTIVPSHLKALTLAGSECTALELKDNEAIAKFAKSLPLTLSALTLAYAGSSKSEGGRSRRLETREILQRWDEPEIDYDDDGTIISGMPGSLPIKSIKFPSSNRHYILRAVKFLLEEPYKFPELLEIDTSPETLPIALVKDLREKRGIACTPSHPS